MFFWHLPFCRLSDRTLESSDWWGIPLHPGLLSFDVVKWQKMGVNPSKYNPRSGTQWNNSAPLHQTPKRLPHSDSKVTTVITRGLKKSPSSVLWKVIASVLFWYLLLLYNLFFQPSELKGVEVPVKCIHSATTCDFKKQIKFIKMTKVSSCQNYVPGNQNACILKLDYFQRKKMERPGYPGFWMRSTKSK